MDLYQYNKQYLIPIDNIEINLENEYNQQELNILKSINKKVIYGKELSKS